MKTNKTYPTIKRPGERDAGRTTIVGGGPPARGVIPRKIPRGLEVLIKKAAVDRAFKKILLGKRAAAAETIALKLEPTEAAMLDAVPEDQLRAIITGTKVNPRLRPAFLGYAAAAMLAALGAVTAACDGPVGPPATLGSQPDPPPKTPPWIVDDAEETAKQKVKTDEWIPRGIRPGRP